MEDLREEWRRRRSALTKDFKSKRRLSLRRVQSSAHARPVLAAHA